MTSIDSVIVFTWQRYENTYAELINVDNRPGVVSHK